MPPDILAALPDRDWALRTQPADLPELMDGPCSPADLRACLRDLAWVNGVLFGYRPILQWLSSLPLSRTGRAIRILDVGCGYGDTLRRVYAWAHRRRIPVELTGLDLSAEAVLIAQQATAPNLPLLWLVGDVFAYKPAQPPHLVISSLMTHHLTDSQIVDFLQWVEQNAQWGWAINDLSRHPTPARLFGLFARLTRLHRFVQHDGPVSFARAFVPADWIRYCAAAGLTRGDVEIRGFTPGRLRVTRMKIDL